MSPQFVGELAIHQACPLTGQNTSTMVGRIQIRIVTSDFHSRSGCICCYLPVPIKSTAVDVTKGQQPVHRDDDSRAGNDYGTDEKSGHSGVASETRKRTEATAPAIRCPMANIA